MVDQKTVLERLKKVIDPETGMDVVTMGLIRELNLDLGGSLKIVFRPSSHVCPLAYHLAFQIQKELQQMPGIGKIDLSVIDFAGAEDLNQMLRGD